jgi:hypothetical protein
MRIFKMKTLTKFARRERIADASMREAIERAERGIVDADLGGGLIKQRVARLGQGRSGGYRMMIAFRTQDRAIFLLGFAKNEQENISPGQLAVLRELVKIWLHAPDKDIAKALKDGVLQEVIHDQDNEAKNIEPHHAGAS